jgi:hypothetical protein
MSADLPFWKISSQKKQEVEIQNLRSLETRRRSQPLIREGYALVDCQLWKIDIRRKERVDI